MPNIRQYDTGALGLNPTETGVQAAAATARRVGAFYNQVAGATQEEAHQTERVARATKELGHDTEKLARDTQRLGHETGALGDFQAHLTAQTGARLGSAVQFASNEAINYVAHREISQGAAEFAQLNSDLTDQWNKTAKTADPNDPSVAGKFHEEVLNPKLDKFKESFVTERGQQWAEGHTASLRNHMFERTAGDMSKLAGDAVHMNTRRMSNAWSNTARNDPSSVPYLLDTADSSIAGVVDTSPNLKGADAARVRTVVSQKAKEDIVRAGALGAIEKSADPEKAASTFADRYPDYVNSQEITQFAQAAKSIKRLNESEARSARVQRDYEAKNDFNKKINELETATMPQNVGDKPQLPPDYWSRLRDLSTHPGAALEPGRLKTMVTQGEVLTERLSKPEPQARVSHSATMDLLTRIRAGDETRLTDNRPIYDAYQSGRLNNADFNFLNREFQNLRTPEGQALDRDRGEFFKRYAQVIDGAMKDAGQHSLLGTQRTYEFEMDARRTEATLRQKGLDPHLVYDPRSEYFFGRPENIAKYHVSFQESQAYEKTFKAMNKPDPNAPAPNKNLTGPGKDVVGFEVIDIPAGMSPQEAVKKYGRGQRVKLPDGRTGTLP